MLRFLRPLSIVALTLAASLTSLPNGFAYDDNHIILKNPVVHTLDGWWNLFRQTYWLGDGVGALYRPLTVLGFAIQWNVGHGSPWMFHAVNILLYVTVCLMFYWLVLQIAPEKEWMAWICAALFAVHPVHVEVVGNVVGQAELACALFIMLGVGLYVKWRREERLTIGRMALLAVIYIIACLFKEHGILLLSLLIAADLTITGISRESFVRLRPFYLAFIAVALFFVWFRYMVIGDLQGDMPHLAWLGATWTDRFWTMCIVAREWFRLFLWPSTLSIDYSPGNLSIRHGPDLQMLPTLVIVVSVILLAFLLRKRAPMATFGVLWMIVSLSLVSNLIIPTGVMLAERTLFLPSAGVIMMMVAAAAFVVNGTTAKIRMPVHIFSGIILSVLLVVGIVHSARRQKIWYNNRTMFTAFFNDAPSDYKGPWIFSGALLRAGEYEESLKMLELATTFYDRDPALLEDLATRYRLMGRCDKAVPLFRKTLEMVPNWTRSRNRMILCLLQQKQFDEAWKEALIGMKEPSSPRAAIIIVRIVLHKKKAAATGRGSYRLSPTGSIQTPPDAPGKARE